MVLLNLREPPVLLERGGRLLEGIPEGHEEQTAPERLGRGGKPGDVEVVLGQVPDPPGTAFPSERNDLAHVRFEELVEFRVPV